jgi:hypothetical protein
MDLFVLELNRNGFYMKEDVYRKLIVAYHLYCMAAEKENSFKYPFTLRRVKNLCEEAGIPMGDQPVFHRAGEALSWFHRRMWNFVAHGGTPDPRSLTKVATV